MITKKLQSVKTLWISVPVAVPREKKHLVGEQLCVCYRSVTDTDCCWKRVLL